MITYGTAMTVALSQYYDEFSLANFSDFEKKSSKCSKKTFNIATVIKMTTYTHIG